MVTVANNNINFYQGLSTDTKPTGTKINGSVFYEIDTGAVYMYDEEHQKWHIQ